jgi:hypothetical protein
MCHGNSDLFERGIIHHPWQLLVSVKRFVVEEWGVEKKLQVWRRGRRVSRL